tara:strand:+ start:1422 stop:1895 length:474 start_codon:yes stop_codon:yes gene_type:complete
MKMTDRASRSAETRAKTARRKPWQPPSMLDAPEAPPGYKHRWVRAEVRGHDDRANMSKRIREGFEPVRAEDHPDFDAPTIEDGKHAGVIGVGGLILAKIPEETVEERNEYFHGKTAEQLQGVDNDLMREADPRMPLRQSDMRRSTKVEFGSRKPAAD